MKNWEYRQTHGNRQDLKIYEVGAPASGGCIAVVPIREGRQKAALEHAALIIAAPRLMEALNALSEHTESYPVPAKVRALVALAIGFTQVAE